jgi:hypothetical protein
MGLGPFVRLRNFAENAFSLLEPSDRKAAGPVARCRSSWPPRQVDLGMTRRVHRSHKRRARLVAAVYREVLSFSSHCLRAGRARRGAAPFADKRSRKVATAAPSRACTLPVSGHGPKQINRMRQTHRAMMMTQLPPDFRPIERVRDWLPIRREQCVKHVLRKSRWPQHAPRLPDLALGVCSGHGSD